MGKRGELTRGTSMTIDLCGVTLRASTTTADIAETCIPPLYLQHEAKRCNAAKAREHIYLQIEEWQQGLVQLLYHKRLASSTHLPLVHTCLLHPLAALHAQRLVAEEGRSERGGGDTNRSRGNSRNDGIA